MQRLNHVADEATHRIPTRLLQRFLRYLRNRFIDGNDHFNGNCLILFILFAERLQVDKLGAVTLDMLPLTLPFIELGISLSLLLLQ
ncbi:MAG: hypothetical protein C0485_07885 [Pirellula sp.]|nr:hypothetical protein [Pirellula sp.]